MLRNNETEEVGVSLSDGVLTAKALGHPARLRILAMLREGDLCVCQITAVLGLASSTISGHLAELRRAGLVEEEKRGRWVHYRLASENEPPQRLGRRMLHSIADDPQILEDARLVQELRRHSPESLCEAGLDVASLGIAPVGDSHD